MNPDAKALEAGFTEEEIAQYKAMRERQTNTAIDVEATGTQVPAAIQGKEDLAKNLAPESQQELTADERIAYAKSRTEFSLGKALTKPIPRPSPFVSSVGIKVDLPEPTLYSAADIVRSSDKPIDQVFSDMKEQQTLALSPIDVTWRAARLGVDPTTQAGVDAVYAQYRDQVITDRYQSEVSLLSSLSAAASPSKWFRTNVIGSDDSYTKVVENNRQTLVDLAKERGVDLVWQGDAPMAKLPDGSLVNADPTFWQGIKAEGYELAGGIAGAMLANAKTAHLRGTGAQGRAINMLASAVGGIAGAVGGGQADYLSAAIEAQAQWEAKAALSHAGYDAEMTLLGEVLGYPIYKASAATLRTAKHWLNMVRDGNTAGAYRALQEATGMTEEQFEEFVARSEIVRGTPLPTKSPFAVAQKEKAVAAAVQGVGGVEDLAAKVASSNISASRNLAIAVDRRAKDLRNMIDEITPENSGEMLLRGLKDYTNDVKRHYDSVKTASQDIIPDTAVFDLKYDTIVPLFKARLQDPTTALSPAGARLQGALLRLDEMRETSTFNDLLEVRQIVNNVKYSSITKAHADRQVVDSAIKSIDNQINEAAKAAGREGEEWLRDWAAAKNSYAMLKNMTNNVIYKRISKLGKIDTSTGVTEDSIAKMMLKYAPSIDRVNSLDDTSYTEIMRKLPPKTKSAVENSMVRKLVDEHTMGREGEFQAISFPSLAKALEVIPFTSPEAKHTADAVKAMAGVYRNDVKIAEVTGKIVVPGAVQALSANFYEKARHTLASRMFNKMMAFVPGKEADNRALIQKAGALLEDPLNARLTSDILKEFKGDAELTAALRQLQQTVAQDMQNGVANVPVFSQNGKLYASPGPGRAPVNKYIPTGRTVSSDIAENILGREGIKDFRQLDIVDRQKLISSGFGYIKDTKTSEVIDLASLTTAAKEIRRVSR